MNEDAIGLITRAVARAGNISRLGRAIGVPRTLIHAWLTGKRTPSLSSMCKIRVYLKDADEMLKYGECS